MSTKSVTFNSIEDNRDFRFQLNQWVAEAVCKILEEYLPVPLHEVESLCKERGVYCRVETHGCGADCNPSRLNLKVDRTGLVKRVSLG